jgi:hypothetical protein
VKDEYKDKATECWYTMVRFAMYGQVRNMPVDAIKQMCVRPRKPKVRPKALMSKKETKDYRGGMSPDDADSWCMFSDLLRHVVGVHPGMKSRNINLTMKRRKSSPKDISRTYDVAKEQDLYVDSF